MIFLFFYELTHLHNGHIEIERISENKLLDQTLEVDADSGAVLHLLNFLYDMKDKLSKNSETDIATQRLNVIYGSSSKALRATTYATYIFFRLFDELDWDLKSQQSETHPFDIMRIHNILVVLYKLLKFNSQFDYDAKIFGVKSGDFVRDIEVAFGLIKKSDSNLTSLLNIFNNQDTYVYLESIRESWNIIRPNLERNKRGGTLSD